MENASKAILIAGAVFLVMLITGVGMYILTTTTDTIDNMNNQIDTFATTAHNNIFSLYDGTVTGGQILECIEKVVARNSDENIDEIYRDMTVKINGTTVITGATTTYTTPQNFKPNKKYSGVTIYDADGIIKSIEFSQ